MLRWSVLALTVIASPSLSAGVGPQLIASADLGFSGAVLTIRSSGIEARTGVDHRTLILVTADNRRLTKVLNDGGGRLRNWSLNLYSVGQNKFVILSEKDCVSIDPVKSDIAPCPIQKPCSPQLGPDAVFLGRFDWMNGFDRPRGTFGLGFRYLPFYDATCGN
jgi:hypothetical protein